MLRLFYACYYAGMGVSVAFFSRYLHSLGLSGRQISFMLAAAPLLNLCGVPLLWGSLADRTRRPDLVLRLISLFGCLLMVPMIFVRTLPGMLILYAGYQAFAVAIMGLVDSITLDRVRQGADYGRIRLWGSFAFALVTPIVGQVLDWRGRSGGDPLVPGAIAAAIGAAFLTSLTVRGQATREHPHASQLRTLLRDRRFLFLLVVAPLHWLCAAPYHGYLGVLFGDRGLSQLLLGTAFLVSVGAEMITLFFFARLRNRFRLAPILALTFAVSSVRWALMGTVQTPWVLVALQATHALTFGAFWGSALAWVGECVPPRLRATGQTLFTGVLYGVGNGLGMLGSGALYDAFHRADEAFLIAAAVELVPLALVLSLGRRMDPLRPAPPTWPPGT